MPPARLRDRGVSGAVVDADVELAAGESAEQFAGLFVQPPAGGVTRNRPTRPRREQGQAENGWIASLYSSRSRPPFNALTAPCSGLKSAEGQLAKLPRTVADQPLPSAFTAAASVAIVGYAVKSRSVVVSTADAMRTRRRAVAVVSTVAR